MVAYIHCIYIGVRGGGSAAPPGLKNFRANSFFRANATCSKILNDKKIFKYSEKFQGNSCSGQAQVAQKSWIIKNTYSVQWIQVKRKLLKNPECKKYIQCSENFLGNSVFQGKRYLLKNPEW